MSWFFFHFQNNLVLTGKDKEVNHTDTSPSEFPDFPKKGLGEQLEANK